MDPKWRTVAATIRNEFHPDVTATPKPDSPSIGHPDYAEVRVHRGDGAQALVTETYEDGSTCVSTVGRRSYVEEPSVQIKPRTFNPFVDMDSYAEARRQGLIPGVRVIETHKPSDNFDMGAYAAYRIATAKRDEMSEWIEARRRGEVPSC